jgi:hypothetical protein
MTLADWWHLLMLVGVVALTGFVCWSGRRGTVGAEDADHRLGSAVTDYLIDRQVLQLDEYYCAGKFFARLHAGARKAR